MFNHIGSKIKGFAKFLFWITAIAGIIGGILVMVVGATNANETLEILLFIFAGLAIMIGGFIFAWLQNFILYGYGELIDSNQKILEILEAKENKTEKK